MDFVHGTPHDGRALRVITVAVQMESLDFYPEVG
jgi:hypothetical protein